MIEQKEIDKLISAGIISAETGKDIANYYAKKDTSNSRLIIVFGILGAILVGLGIILVIAHNWDNLSIAVKSIIAFIPLLIGQAACLYTLLKKNENVPWIEGASTFLYLSIGSCMAMISQIYALMGDFSNFILVWTLLGCGLIYLMKSSLSSAIYIVGITVYSISLFQVNNADLQSIWYGPLLFFVIPYYFSLIKNQPTSNFTYLHHWLIAISICCVHWTFYKEKTMNLILLNYICLFGLYYLIGSLKYFKNIPLLSNGYKVIGFLGSLIVMFILSFDTAYYELANMELGLHRSLILPVTIFLVLIVSSLFLLKQQSIGVKLQEIHPLKYLFLVVAALFMSKLSFVAVLIINLLILLLGVFIIKDGMKNNYLLKVNVGLSIISILIICRFFDTNIHFVLKGLLFVSLGIGFFMVNYFMLKEPSSHE